MRLLLAVAAGGAAGSVARWWVSGWFQNRMAQTPGPAALFPLGTFAVNLIGCFFIGLGATLFQERLTVAPEFRLLILAGVLGGFTTFSTFGLETVELMREGNLALAAANVFGSLTLGLAGVWLGVALARAL